ncbi:MAG: 16S rRNA (cytidine(1402)-2'-O)-methyltransferase [Pseudomonadota bacterium]
MEPALYIVATPIGNLGDITRRAMDVLREASTVAAEDTRRTGQLLANLGISRPLVAYHEHSADTVADRLVRAIAAGESVALVSDAGTPTISDPGYRLVRAVQEEGLAVVPIPGACALIAALSASGLPSDRFTFGGFLPAKRDARRQRLTGIAAADATQIFYEAPHRIEETLEDLVDCVGADREAALARELTKRFETLRRGSLGELRDWLADDTNQARGELVVLLGPPTREEELLDEPALMSLLADLSDLVSARQAAKLLARHSRHSSRDLYHALLRRRAQS